MKRYSVTVTNNGVHRSIYEGASLHFAQHDVNTAHTSAVLAAGTLTIVLRENGEVRSSINVVAGKTVEAKRT